VTSGNSPGGIEFETRRATEADAAAMADAHFDSI
jgi:hypothetical protein